MSILTFGLIAFVLQFCSAVDDDLNPIWEQWKQNHNRSFLNASANLLARVNFERVNDIIRQANNNSRHSFACGHNRFSDWSADQFRSFNAYRHRNAIAKRDIEEPVIKRTILASEAVSMNDWPVTPIRDQKQCGSCYIFASVAFLESYYLIKQGQSLDLSEQQVLDCGVGYYNTNINGVYCGQGGIGQCNGGDPACVFAYWLSSTTASSVGASKIESYESGYAYTSNPATCRNPLPSPQLTLPNFAWSASFSGPNEDSLMTLLTAGPVVVSIYSSGYTFQSYRSGVYNDNSNNGCPSGVYTDHVVLLIGYGTDATGGNYWKIKNSWGTGWGENGFMRLARGSKMCSIGHDTFWLNNQASFPTTSGGAPVAPTTPPPTTAAPSPVNCVGAWSAYGPCSVTACGQNGVQTSTYTITRQAANGGSSCPNSNGDIRTLSCSTPACGAQPTTPPPTTRAPVNPVPVPTAPTNQAPIAGYNGNAQTEILDTHNRLRALACVPPLRWNPYLAQVAYNYGSQCITAHNNARTTDYETILRNAGQPVPSSNTADYPDCSAVGENIASTINGPAPYVTTAFWESEEGSTCYEGGGHYTQMLWNLTTDVGCAKINCGGGQYNLICNYWPAGNFNGMTPALPSSCNGYCPTNAPTPPTPSPPPTNPGDCRFACYGPTTGNFCYKTANSNGCGGNCCSCNCNPPNASAPTPATRQPTAQPTPPPTTRQPTRQPTALPTPQPTTRQPTGQPTAQPTTRQPTRQPTALPTAPTTATRQPTRQPTALPTPPPTTRQPTALPTPQPTTRQPTRQPTALPTAPTTSTRQPTAQPSKQPTSRPSSQPTAQPSRQPTGQPSRQPTGQPSRQPTGRPTAPAPVNCVGAWSAYGPCSVTACGQTGVQTSTYTITRAAANGGTACPYGNGYAQYQACSTPACPNNGIPPCSTYNNDVGDLFHANVDAVITLWNRDLATTYGFLAPSIYPQSQYPIYLTDENHQLSIQATVFIPYDASNPNFYGIDGMNNVCNEMYSSLLGLCPNDPNFQGYVSYSCQQTYYSKRVIDSGLAEVGKNVTLTFAQPKTVPIVVGSVLGTLLIVVVVVLCILGYVYRENLRERYNNWNNKAQDGEASPDATKDVELNYLSV